MTNGDIDNFFASSRLGVSVEKTVAPPSELWQFKVGPFPVLVQTQDEVNRMRIVAFIAKATTFDEDELRRLLNANYHTALDARYALADDNLVAAFIHPLKELTREQFVLGLSQALSCAGTFGSTYSGGHLVFGHVPSTTNGETMERSVKTFLDALQHQINGRN